MQECGKYKYLYPNSKPKKVLSLGLTFIPTPHPKKIWTKALLEDSDNLKQTYIQKYQCTASTGFTLDKICKRIIGSLKNVQTYHPIPNLREHFKTALEELRNNKELILCKADKGDASHNGCRPLYKIRMGTP